MEIPSLQCLAIQTEVASSLTITVIIDLVSAAVVFASPAICPRDVTFPTEYLVEVWQSAEQND